MSGERVFVDSNILVYAYDLDAGGKHDVAKREVANLWEEEDGALSIQVLQEFYVTATRKLSRPITRRKARELIETYEVWSPHQPTVADLVAASELEERHRLTFWDALIVTSAQRTGCAIVLSEDLQNGRQFGEVTVVNPFADRV